MIISLDKLIDVRGNKYLFTKAAHTAIDRKDNIKDYPHEERGWKVVPTVLQMMFDGKVNYVHKEQGE
jgi:hypothetical protein